MSNLTLEEKRKVRKPLLWIGMASIVMTFAGLTSGYVVSRSALMVDNRWLEFALPTAFYVATAVMILSSISMVWAKAAVKKGNIAGLRTALVITLILALAFVALQLYGATDMIDRGLFFTGPKSNSAVSWVYIIAALHWLHVISGIIVLIVTLIRAQRGAYTSTDHYGLDMSAIYWHFLDVLWIYLFLFLAFIR
ncbi:MAG: cytochrome c oxidase subunit 3 [Owenweeksia sp.]